MGKAAPPAEGPKAGIGSHYPLLFLREVIQDVVSVVYIRDERAVRRKSDRETNIFCREGCAVQSLPTRDVPHDQGILLWNAGIGQQGANCREPLAVARHAQMPEFLVIPALLVVGGKEGGDFLAVGDIPAFDGADIDRAEQRFAVGGEDRLRDTDRLRYPEDWRPDR